jgi:hypothetical protein
LIISNLEVQEDKSERKCGSDSKVVILECDPVITEMSTKNRKT